MLRRLTLAPALGVPRRGWPRRLALAAGLVALAGCGGAPIERSEPEPRLRLVTTAEPSAGPATPAIQPLLPPRAVPQGVIGADDRRPVDSGSWPWSAIGRVNRGIDSGFCTGVLVGADRVVTAAHCVYDRQRRGPVHPADLHFVAGYDRGSFVAHATARRVFLPTADAGSGPFGRPQDGWAVLVLERPLAIPPLGLASAQAASGDGRLVRAGYGQDRAHALSAHFDCRVFGGNAGPGSLSHTCDAVRGDSGSPLLWFATGRAPVVVGITVGTRGSGSGTTGTGIDAGEFRDAVLRSAAVAPPSGSVLAQAAN